MSTEKQFDLLNKNQKAEGINSFVCPRCGGELDASAVTSQEIVCGGCGQQFPVILNKIPILLSDAYGFLSEIYLQYEQYFRRQELEINKLELAHTSGERSEVLRKLKAAIQANTDYIKSIQNALAQHVSVESLVPLLVSERNFTPYLTNWAYLQRDWCWLPEGEQELEAIKESLFQILSACTIDVDSVLVVGAGAGRIAWDLCEVCRHVYATDKALTMAYQFQDLLDHDIRFSEINLNNVFHSDDMVRSLKASLYSPFKDRRARQRQRGSLSYVIADALHAPVRDNSISAVVSVYFTDLVPIKRYIHEVKRVLSHGGVFFHFGPLEYDLPDVSDHYSASEIKELFISNNFAICEDKRLLSTHLRSALSMTNKIYNNWIFAAVNQNLPRPPSTEAITLDSILEVADSVKYQINGSISADEEKLIETSLTLPSGEKYMGAKSVLDILRVIDGLRRNHEVIELLSKDYEVSDEAAQHSILEVMTLLVQKRLLSVVQY